MQRWTIVRATDLEAGRYLLDDAEEIDVGVVDGEVDEDRARGSVQPEVHEQRPEHRERFCHALRQILDETSAAVRPDLTPVA